MYAITCVKTASMEHLRAVIKVTFIGAGSVEFTRNVATDLCGYPEFRGSLHFALYDISAERLAHAEQLASRISAQAGAGAVVTATQDRRAALAGAGYVINEVQVGGYDATRADFDIPARYGVRQTIGDTLGIGGIFRGLRTIPVVTALARDMQEVCPDAYLLSYSNPMAMLPWAVYGGTAFRRVFGLCHSVRDTQAFLTRLVGADPDRVRFLASSRTASPCTRGWPRSSRTRPSCTGGSAWRSSAGSGTSRPSPASTLRSTCRGSCAMMTRSSGFTSSWATTWRGPRRTCAS
jgi:Family 4 glycosyl hydrolase